MTILWHFILLRENKEQLLGTFTNIVPDTAFAILKALVLDNQNGGDIFKAVCHVDDKVIETFKLTKYPSEIKTASMGTSKLLVSRKQFDILSTKATEIGLTVDELLLQACPVVGTTVRYGRYEGYYAITVPWCGMQLCIEPDGHSHT